MTDDGDEEIVDVEVEAVGGVSARPEGDDIATVEVERAAPDDRGGNPPPAESGEKRLRPPVDKAARTLRLLIAVAAVVLLCLSLYLFRIVDPGRYADFRSLFPDGWRFPPPTSVPASSGTNLSGQG